jgi:hypothetical protein
VREELRAGLEHVIRDVPLAHGYVEAGAAVSKNLGPEGWIEAGYRPFTNAALFGRGYVRPDDYGAMVGLKWEW